MWIHLYIEKNNILSNLDVCLITSRSGIFLTKERDSENVNRRDILNYLFYKTKYERREWDSIAKFKLFLKFQSEDYTGIFH